MAVEGLLSLLLLVLLIAVEGYLIWLFFRALSLMRKGAIEITEAAQELNNNKLHDAGSNLNQGINIVYRLAQIGLALLIIGLLIITIATVAALS